MICKAVPVSLFPLGNILKPAFSYSSSTIQPSAQKCGNCQKNWIMNSVPGSIPKSSVAATHPNMKGMAPGNAPTKTERGDIVFSGVYTLVYRNKDIAPNMAVLGLRAKSDNIPSTVNATAIVSAVLGDIRPEGMGRFLVRFIRASKSFSMIWLYALEAPTIQYPPKVSNKSEMI